MPVKAESPRLQAQMTVSEAFRAVAFACLAHLQHNERGLLESGDAEYLHQARVALRRLRSAFSVFSAAFPRLVLEEVIVELRWLGVSRSRARLGCLRVGDAHGRDERAPGRSRPARAPRVDDRAENSRWRRCPRRGCVQALHQSLTEPDRPVLPPPLEALSDQAAADERTRPLPEFAAAVLTRRQRKVIKRGRNLAGLDAAALHALRIDIKKVRYAAEFFSSLYDSKAVRDYTDALAHLQSLLGGLNDAATVERLCEQSLAPVRESQRHLARSHWAGARMGRRHRPRAPRGAARRLDGIPGGQKVLVALMDLSTLAPCGSGRQLPRS